MKILYKFASRSRPEKFFKCLDNIISLAKHDDYKILASLDFDDESMNNLDVIDKMKSYENLIPIFGYSKSKMHAVNRDMDVAPEFDILVNTSDDMIFELAGFDLEIIKDFGNNLDQFIHYNDGNQKANVSTLSIMGSTYYKRFNYIYHPDYKGLWADVEACDVAYALGRYKYMGDEKILFRHMHPAWGLTEWDAQYKKDDGNLDVWAQDLTTLIKRKKNGYYLGSWIYDDHKYSESEMKNWINDLNNARKNNGLQPINF